MLLTEYLKKQLDQLSYDAESGIAYGSVRLAARMAGVDESSIREGLGGAGLGTTKLSEYLDSKGFEGAGLVAKRGLSADVITAICTYYALKAGRYCNDTAGESLEMFAQIGLTIAIKQSIGVAVDDYAEPNIDTIIVGSVGTRTPGVITAENKWLDELTKLRQRVATRLLSNPALVAAEIAKLDAQIEAGYAASLPFFSGKTVKKSPAVRAPKATVVANHPEAAVQKGVTLVTVAECRIKGNERVYSAKTKSAVRKAVGQFLESRRGHQLTASEIAEGCISSALIQEHGLTSWARSVARMLADFDWVFSKGASGKRQSLKNRDANGKATANKTLYVYAGASPSQAVKPRVAKAAVPKLPPLHRATDARFEQQSFSGKRGALAFAGRSVYRVLPLVVDRQLNAVPSKITARVHSAVALAVDGFALGSIIDGGDLATAVFTPEIVSTTPAVVLNRKIGFALPGLGYERIGTYDAQGGGAVSMYMRSEVPNA